MSQVGKCLSSDGSILCRRLRCSNEQDAAGGQRNQQAGLFRSAGVRFDHRARRCRHPDRLQRDLQDGLPDVRAAGAASWACVKAVEGLNHLSRIRRMLCLPCHPGLYQSCKSAVLKVRPRRAREGETSSSVATTRVVVLPAASATASTRDRFQVTDEPFALCPT
jgi:hypothetical protein